MKKFLSTVLALVMVLTTFAMLVPNAVAAGEPQQVEAKVLYEENFDDLEGELPAEILAGANMTDEKSGMQDYLTVKDGKLYYGSYTNQDRASYVVLSDDRLLNGYAIQYDLTYLEYSDGQNPICFTSCTKSGFEGYLSQVRPNGGTVTGLRNGSWDNANVSSANNFSAAMRTALGDTESTLTNLKDRKMTVKSEINPSTKTVNTYVDGSLVQTHTSTVEHGDYFTKDIRLCVYPGTVAKIDNLVITTLDGQTTFLNQTFESENVKNAGNDAEFLAALEWASVQAELAGGKHFRCDSGSLILGQYASEAVSGQEELILGGYNEEAKNGFVVEYDFEIINTTGAGTANKSLGFYSAKAKGAADFYGWFSQMRWGRNVVCGVHDDSRQGNNNAAVQNAGTDYNEGRIVTLTGGKASVAGYRLAVRAVFDPQSGYVTTYAKTYTGEALEWTEADAVQKSPSLAGREDLFDGYIRLIFEGNFKAYVDNIKITALEKTPNVVGYQEHATENQIRLLGVIDNDIFTKAEKVGFRVTMTKTAGGDPVTKDIDCNYVYSSITAWNTEATTAAGFMHGASHVYALHIKGITESVNIVVTPYYVDEGVMYLGDASETIAYVVD